MKLNRSAGGALVGMIMMSGCGDVTPTSTNAGLIPVTPRTVEVRLPFSTFGRDVQLHEGFGRTAEVTARIVANDFEGAFNARTLIRFGAFPTFVQVSNSSGVVVTDSNISYIGGRVVAVVDTTTAVAPQPVQLEAASLIEHWDEDSANWTHAVDTIGDVVPWSEGGAGPVTIFDTSTWTPGLGDTVVFDVDSATANEWADTENTGRGLRLSTHDAGTRLEFLLVQFDVDIRSSVNTDTVVVQSVFAIDNLFVYDPPPPPATPSEFRIGGAPAWRTTFKIALPESLDGPLELCEAAGCPFALTAESVNFARLLLTSAASPPGFQPDDTLSMDVRAVLSEENLPKSPIGPSLAGLFGVRAPPEYFGGEEEGEVGVTLTGFVQDAVRGTDLGGDPAPSSLSLLSIFEPLSVELMTFQGPGAPAEPVLRLILTTRVGVPLK